MLILAGMCAVGLAIRIYVAWWKGYLVDLQTFQGWAIAPRTFSEPYASLESLKCNYPPLWPCVLKALSLIHASLHLPGDLSHPIAVDFTPAIHRPVLLLLKSPAMAADIVSACLVALVASCVGARGRGLALAALVLFNPALIYDGAYYGQTDTVLVMFLLATLAAFILRKPLWLGAMMAAAVLMKAQSVFLVVLILAGIVAQWRTIWGRRCHRIVVGAMLVVAGVAACAWAADRLAQFVDGYRGVVGQYPRTSSHAFNFWWLVTRPWNATPITVNFPADTERVFGLVSYFSIGLALWAAAMAVIIWRAHRAAWTAQATALVAVAAGWAFFNLLTEMHERYSVPAVGLMCLLPLWERRWYALTLVASVTVTFNVAEVGPLFMPQIAWLQQAVNWFIWPERHLVWTAMAAIHVLMLLLAIESLWKLRTPLADRTGGADTPPAPCCPTPARTA